MEDKTPRLSEEEKTFVLAFNISIALALLALASMFIKSSAFLGFVLFLNVCLNAWSVKELLKISILNRTKDKD